MAAESIRVRGLVQGVGLRPTVWRLARECGLVGDVRNDGAGVLIRLAGEAGAIDRFCDRLAAECPPLARIDVLERSPADASPGCTGFRIVNSRSGDITTGVVPDAATCAACAAEILEPANRRYRYPFTNCTHCGPRLSIIRGIPYDRDNTSMAWFAMCERCMHEYRDPADRRFHAQPNACPICGPHAWLEDRQGHRLDTDEADAVAAADRLLRAGDIVAIKGIGGFHLACDAADADAVSTLRARKHRYRKPFALMARDLSVIGHYARIGKDEAALLQSSEAPIVLLEAGGDRRVAADVAPGQQTLGFMLPNTPLHQLLLSGWDRPLIMTSGNRSDEPQCIDNADAKRRLDGIADAYLLHDRDIVNRVDDSVARYMFGATRLLRRARGYAPAPIALPADFGDAPPVCAMGGELKNTCCLLHNGRAIVTQHLGDLENASAAEAYRRTLELYLELFQHEPEVVAVDLHPDYVSTRDGHDLAARFDCRVEAVQHHHAHIASVLADNARPRAADPVLGIALDGLGLGDDGEIWGAELLFADYVDYRRVARLASTRMPGGTKAILEPWRNTVAHLHTHFGWRRLLRDFPGLELTTALQRKPVDVLLTMMERGLNAPPSSSCGRLFDAVSAALGVCRGAISYEGQAAIELEALALTDAGFGDGGYRFGIDRDEPVWRIDPAPMWHALLNDLGQGVTGAVIAGRFHTGLSDAIAETAIVLASALGADTIALSGGVFQNRSLLERIGTRLECAGLTVLTHHQVPTNDGGLALGQAAVAAARSLATGP